MTQGLRRHLGAAAAGPEPAGPLAPEGAAGWTASLGRLTRQNWLAALLLAVGLVLRVLVQVAYRPALFYIDTTKYLYSAQGNDPVGYRVPLRGLLLIGNFNLVVAVQHLLGLAMAVALYAVLRRRGVARWLAALAIAPVLLDAYQLQMEQMVMPDTWFEALVVAGLVLLLWKSRPRYLTVLTGGLLLGASATFWQVGEFLILPALAFLLVAASPWKARLRLGAVLCGAFAVPIIAYCSAALLVTGHFWLSHSGATTLYGRMAAAADCATVKLPPSERALCPTAAQKALGPDGLLHSPLSPERPYYLHHPSYVASRDISAFNKAVLKQQPLQVLGAYGSDVAKLFAVTRQTAPGDTPISRWQFQQSYPYFQHATPQMVDRITARFGGGRPAVARPLASFLRGYQLHGGFTPGPAYLLAALAGLVATLSLAWRRADPGQRALALGAMLLTGTAAAILLVADVEEFSWRYQLPAVVTLIPAGALGLAALAALWQVRGAPPQ